MEMHTRTLGAVSAIERERMLWLASGQYMRGEITGEQFAEIRRRYDFDLKKAVITLAKRNKKQRQQA